MVLFGLGTKQQSDWHRETQSKEKIDWTHFLSPDAVSLLRKVLEKAYKHRTAYFKADDIKSAQLWSAILEMQAQIDELSRRVGKLEPREQKVYRSSLSDDEATLNKLNEVMQPTPQDSREATDALVNSLMRF